MRIVFGRYTTPRRVLPAIRLCKMLRRDFAPLERGTLVRGKTGGIPRFCGMALVALFIAMPAFAETDSKTVTSKKYVDDQIATKQPILNANEADLRNNVVMYTDQAGTVAAKPISATLSGTGIDNNLPTVGAVNTGLADKQNIIPAKNTTKVVTYTATAGSVGEHDIYQGATATYNPNGLIESNHANSAIAKGLNEHLTCAPNGIDPVSNNCWLWQINDQAAGTVYTDHQ